MDGAALFGIDWQVFLIFGLIIAIFVAFIREKLPPDIIAMGGFCIVLLFGLIDMETALSVFSNPAPITIGALFVLSAALERTGCVEYLGKFISRIAGESQFSLILAILPVVLIISAFMNNTPVVIILTPVLISLARKIDLPSSKILIPLSYTAILGGMTTLIGSSTNLLVHGIAVQKGIEGFSMFEITMPAIIMATAGCFFILFIGRHILPDRESLSGILGTDEGKQYTVQLLVPHKSSLIGKKTSETVLSKGDQSVIIDVLRHGDSMRRYLEELELQSGDRIILETNASELLGIKETGIVDFTATELPGLEPMSAEENVMVEGIVGPNSDLSGKFASGLHSLTRYGVKMVGVHKPEKHFVFNRVRSKLNVGDALLLEGPARQIKKIFEDHALINLSVPQDKPIRRRKAPIALAAVLTVVILAALGIFPIAVMALIGAFIVTVTRCIDPDEVYRAIDWPILFLIFGMLGVAEAMAASGALELIVRTIVVIAEAYGPLAMLAAFYLITSILTELVSNTAVAALLAPIAISLALAMGVDPKPFLVAVMFAGSASFVTPIGYQTNTFVYGAGGYKFRDFFFIGLPLNLMMFGFSMVLIPIFWPF
ncbi:MAG: SLC13 family permease [Pseudomonadota bacterium]